MPLPHKISKRRGMNVKLRNDHTVAEDVLHAGRRKAIRGGNSLFQNFIHKPWSKKKEDCKKRTEGKRLIRPASLGGTDRLAAGEKKTDGIVYG